jgi:hypothetical protein
MHPFWMEENLSNKLPSELRAFLYSCFDSWEQVELLVGVLQSGRAWTARAVSAEFRLAETAARHHLETLTARGLLGAKPGEETVYRYVPRTPDLARYCELLRHFHETAPTAVLTYMGGARRSARKFSDAFKLRNPE